MTKYGAERIWKPHGCLDIASLSPSYRVLSAMMDFTTILTTSYETPMVRCRLIVSQPDRTTPDLNRQGDPS